jgi:hypothetical protein
MLNMLTSMLRDALFKSLVNIYQIKCYADDSVWAQLLLLRRNPVINAKVNKIKIFETI